MGVLGTGSFDTVREEEFHRCSMPVGLHHDLGCKSKESDGRVCTLHDLVGVLTERHNSRHLTVVGQVRLQ